MLIGSASGRISNVNIRLLFGLALVATSSVAVAEPATLYCMGIFANGSPFQTELAIDDEKGTVTFNADNSTTLAISRGDRFKYEWTTSDEDVQFVTVLNRFTGELTSIRKAEEGEPERHFQANCYTADDQKF